VRFFSANKAASAAFVVSAIAILLVQTACSSGLSGASSFAPSGSTSSKPEDKSENKPVSTVESVDLNRYQGQWFELARLPNRFQDLCKSNVNATYSVDGAGRVKVENRCLTDKNELKQVVGEARSVNVGNSKLEVRFAPPWLSWLPLVWGDYWVLHLESDYSAAVVGSPDRKFLWVLSRTQQMSKVRMDLLLDKARLQGFPVDLVQVTVQK
jgi:apolipoprotein D and lipocalin family protein